ncbi:PAS domain S-box protein [Nostoc sp. UHCC 0302]|uniref:sensor histidine kinase n=1 Tax=Nostoc sp. UHCC 0302 TaxID=3134896 RepID=UPI00311CA970
MLALNRASVACVSKAQTVDETVKSLHTPDCQQETINLLSKFAVNLPGMIFQVLQRQDGSPFVLYISSGCRDLCELEPEVVQENFQVLHALVYPQDIKGFKESIAVSAATFVPWHWEGRIITPSGKLKWIQATSQPEQQANGDFVWDGLVMDITDRKQAEEKLRESEARYKALLDAIPDLMFRISRDGNYLDLKDEGVNITLSREEIVGKNLQELLPSDVAAISQEAIAKTLDSGTLQTCEYQLPTPLGIRDYEARLVVSGIDEVLAIVRDITERKQAEVSLQNFAQKFAKAFSCSPDPITITTLKEGRFIEVNDSFVKLIGYERDETIGQRAFELNVWVNERDRLKLLQELQTTGVVRNLELEFRRKSGEIVAAQLSAEVITLDGIPCILAVHHDITERKQVEAQLRLSAQRDRLLTETLARIRSSLKLDQILQTTVTEVRQFLRADRVFIGLKNANSSGTRTLAESVDPQYLSISDSAINDEADLQELRNLLKTNVVRVFEDTAQTTLSPRVKAHFQKFQIKASLAVPIMLGNELFGALIANQCSSPRHWQPMEIDLLQQMSEQVAIAIQQSLIYQELAELNTNLEQQVQERTAQLQQKMAEIEDLHRVKDVVLHTVAHDLKTSVMGNLMVLKNLLNQGGEKQRGGGAEGQEAGSILRLPSLRDATRSLLPQRDKTTLKASRSVTGGAGEKNFPSSPMPNDASSLKSAEPVSWAAPQCPMPNPHYPLSPEGGPPSPVPVSRSIIERMIQGNDRQLTMINSLLEINSCEETLRNNRELVQFSKLLQGMIADWQPVLTQNQATMKNLVPEDLPLVLVDATRIQKILSELLTHSLQHNPPGLNLTLIATVDAGMIRTEIQHNGVTMSKPECDRLFDLYVPNPQDCCSTSIGLKMYLCRKVIKAHGGEIGVITDRKPGLTFWFTLPLASVSA